MGHGEGGEAGRGRGGRRTLSREEGRAQSRANTARAAAPARIRARETCRPDLAKSPGEKTKKGRGRSLKGSAFSRDRRAGVLCRGHRERGPASRSVTSCGLGCPVGLWARRGQESASPGVALDRLCCGACAPGARWPAGGARLAAACGSPLPAAGHQASTPSLRVISRGQSPAVLALPLPPGPYSTRSVPLSRKTLPSALCPQTTGFLAPKGAPPPAAGRSLCSLRALGAGR